MQVTIILLDIAASEGHLEIVKYLVNKGANIHAGDDYAVRVASRRGHLEIVKYLIKKGADIHARNEEALRDAVLDDKLETVKCLIDHGACPHILTNYQLIYAELTGQNEIPKYLRSKMKEKNSEC